MIALCYIPYCTTINSTRHARCCARFHLLLLDPLHVGARSGIYMSPSSPSMYPFLWCIAPRRLSRVVNYDIACGCSCVRCCGCKYSYSVRIARHKRQQPLLILYYYYCCTVTSRNRKYPINHRGNPDRGALMYSIGHSNNKQCIILY